MKYKTVVAAAFLLAVSLAQAADPQVESLLSHMREAYKSVKSATYKAESTVYPPNGQSAEVSVDFAYKSPNLIRAIEKIGSAVITKVSNGKKITVTAPDGSADQDYSLDEFEKGLYVNLESLCFWDWARQLSTAKGDNMEHSTFKLIKDEEWNGKHWIVLEETAAKDSVFCRYFIDPKTYFIWRTRVKDLKTMKDQMDAHIIHLNPNANLSDDSFTGS